jgi:hypothetical protein
VWSHLAVENGSRDIGIKGRHLAPPLGSIIACQVQQADIAIGKCFQAGDFHRRVQWENENGRFDTGILWVDFTCYLI